MTVDYLIIGQGIAGTWLSYYLDRQGASILVIDNAAPNSSSRLAAGVINPVTGRRHVTVWMDDVLLPFANQGYAAIGSELGITAISQTDIIDLFPTAQMRQSFAERSEAGASYISLEDDDHAWSEYFEYSLGSGMISPVYTVHLESLLSTWRKSLLKKQQLLQETFQPEELLVTQDGIRYGDISARKILFCNGSQSASYSFFERLPFAPNKGELLILEIPGLPKTNIYKKGMVLVPMEHQDRWWLGSNYAWAFEDEQPTSQFREQAESLLRHWLKLPYRLIDQLAGIRPATLERRPFVGLHPVIASIGILNGFGTKGCSLAPYFAHQLASHLMNGSPIQADADIHRFTNILSKQ
jgi:glycine/D-amino acid oxidase-like deaminating enzyme